MKATRKTIPILIEKRETFTNSSGTLKGMKCPPHDLVSNILIDKSCQLDDDETSRLRLDNDTVGIAYLVMSYDTPIAWETKDGWVYKVSQKFSQTTSKHQGMLYLFHNKVI